MILTSQTAKQDAIPVAYIIKRIQDSCGPESVYLSRLLRRWEDENE